MQSTGVEHFPSTDSQSFDFLHFIRLIFFIFIFTKCLDTFCQYRRNIAIKIKNQQLLFFNSKLPFEAQAFIKSANRTIANPLNLTIIPPSDQKQQQKKKVKFAIEPSVSFDITRYKDYLNEMDKTTDDSPLPTETHIIYDEGLDEINAAPPHLPIQPIITPERQEYPILTTKN